jgi:hypothetical protein
MILPTPVLSAARASHALCSPQAERMDVLIARARAEIEKVCRIIEPVCVA